MAYSMGGMAVASTAFNTAMTAVTAVSQIRRIGNGAFDMARGFMGGGGQTIAPVSEAQIGIGNINAQSSFAKIAQQKNGLDSLTNSLSSVTRKIKVQQQYGNLPSHNGAWGQFPSGGASGGVSGMGGGVLTP